MQLTQTELPSRVLYVPLPHGPHVELEMAPTARDAEPLVQFMQGPIEPEAPEYWPARHGAQVAGRAAPCTADQVPGEQAVHVALEVAPVDAE